MAKGIHKTQIYLDEGQYQYLRREAKKFGSIANVVRHLIDGKLRYHARRDDSLFRLGTKPFKSGLGDLSTKHDKYLYGDKE